MIKPWCWWCCHPFETAPLALPIEYDDRRDRFVLVGVFCSWGCVRAYNASSSSYLSGRVANNIALLHKRVEGRIAPIKSAPPRQALAVFGGPLSIEEFRAGTGGTYKLLPKNAVHRAANLVRVPEVVEAAAAKKKKKEQAVVNFDDATPPPKAEPLRLRRAKPTSNHRNTLESATGITFFKKK